MYIHIYIFDFLTSCFYSWEKKLATLFVDLLLVVFFMESVSGTNGENKHFLSTLYTA